ncbi:unnamed protein product [Effrenium voratum]|nr:unnamed protein product [Effrenium voratum]
MERDYNEVKQTILEAGKGNALQAAVASVVRVALEEVPNFIEDPSGYEQACQTWLAPRKLAMRKMLLEANQLPADEAQRCVGLLCILRGVSPRGDHGHVVVARVIEKGLLGARGCGYFAREAHQLAGFQSRVWLLDGWHV